MTKEKQKWRYASASVTVKGLTEAAKCFPELSSLLDTLDENLFVEGYLEWAQNQTDSIFTLKCEQIFLYLQAIINLRTGVRSNRPSLRLAAQTNICTDLVCSATSHLPINRNR